MTRTPFVRTLVGTAVVAAAGAFCGAASAEVIVTKIAETSFTRTYAWDIDKTASTSALSLAVGGSADVDYTVTALLGGFADSDWAVSGQITIVNDSAVDTVTLQSVADVLSSGVVASVSCPTLTIAAGGSITCSYAASLPDGSSLLNTAVATLADGSQVTGTSNVIFGDPTTLVNATVTIDDSSVGTLGTASGTRSFTYTRTLGPYALAGTFVDVNVATIAETGQFASATVTVTVPAAGTLALFGLGLAGLAFAARRLPR